MLASAPLCLSGRCTITEVQVQRDIVTAAVTAAHGAMVVDLAGLEQTDVTLVQLLVAARAEAGRRGRAFAVAAWSPAALDTFTRAGIEPAGFAPLAAIGA